MKRSAALAWCFYAAALGGLGGFAAGFVAGEQSAALNAPAVASVEATPEAPPQHPVEVTDAGNVTLAPDEPCTPWNPDSPSSAPANPC